MPSWPMPPDEPERLAALRSLRILDTPPDPRFDALTRVAARMLQVPMALVALIDAERQWLKSAFGCLPSGSEMSREVSFCAHALLRPDQPLVVEDATLDPRLAGNPLVLGPPGIRFYAGVPIVGAQGHAFGAFCVLDTKPRRLSAAELDTLRDLAGAVSSLLDLQHSLLALQESEEHHRHRIELSPHIPWSADANGLTLEIGPRWLEVTGLTREQALGEGWMQVVHPDDRADAKRQWDHALRTGEPLDAEYRLRIHDGTYRWFRDYAAPRRDGSGAIVRWYGSAEDIHQRKLSEARVEFLAYHDSLTGLANRARFREQLDHEVARARRGGSFGLLAVDLDNFKAVNDTLGHPQGDALLVEVTKRLQACTREVDLIARVGGDEFLIIAPGMEQPVGAAQLAQRLLDALRQPVDLQGHATVAGASIGITLCPRDGIGPDTLLQNADLALYQAKAQGGDAFRFFQPGISETLARLRML